MTKKNTTKSSMAIPLEAENAKLKAALQLKTRENTLSQLLFGAANAQNITSFSTIIENNITQPLTMFWPILSVMYKTHGIIQTAIDMPVLDAVRGGLDLESQQLSEEELGELQDDLEEEGIIQTVVEAFIWGRLFGGGAVIINTDQDPRTPLNLRKVRLLNFISADRWELEAESRQSEEFVYNGVKLHKSRVITVGGKRPPRWVRYMLQGWDMSIVESIVEDFNRYLKTSNVLYELLEEAKIDVYRMNGFNDQLVSQGGTESVMARIQTVNKLKSFNKALLLDKEDEYDQKQMTFSGLAEVWKENRIGIASALRMPQSKIFGLSSSGFSSGEDDIENYNAMVESEIRGPMRKVLRQILQIKCAQKFQLPETDLAHHFKPLRVLGADQEETIKASKSTRILAWQTAGNLTRQEAAQMGSKEGLILEASEAERGLMDDFGNPNEPEPKPGEGGEGGGKDE